MGLIRKLLPELFSTDGRNLINPTFKVAGVTMGFLIGRRIYRFLIQSRVRSGQEFIDERPTIAYSGAASLWCYYTGVYYYLYHNFDLSNVRVTGISMGVTTAFATVLNMRPSQKFHIGLHWASMIWNRPLACFLMSASDWVDVGVKVTKQFGMTDELVQKYIGSSTIFCGVTDISVFPPQHVLLTDASSLGEAFYWTTLSQRIFPFYRYPGYYKGMLIADGFFSAIWSKPPNLDESKYIRITPFPVPGADVCPKRGSGECFSVIDVGYSKSKERMWRQLQVGFKCAERAHDALVRKGLMKKSCNERDKFGSVGTMEHMLYEFDDVLEEFKKTDKKKTWGLEDISRVSKAKVDGILLVRVSFYTTNSVLHLRAGTDNEAEEMVSCLTGCLSEKNWDQGRKAAEGTRRTLRVAKCELCTPSESKGVKIEVIGECSLEMGLERVSVVSIVGGGGEVEFGYEQVGLCSFDKKGRGTRVHLNDGRALIIADDDEDVLRTFRNIVLGRSAVQRLLLNSKRARNILFDNNGDKGLDLDQKMLDRESKREIARQDPFRLGGDGEKDEEGEGLRLALEEVERYGAEAAHYSGDGSFGGRLGLEEGNVLVEGSMATCVEYEGGEAGGMEGPWKELHFTLVMEKEDDAVLPFLHCYSSSRKRRLLFKAGVANSALYVGGGEGLPVPEKYGYGFGLSLGGDVMDGGGGIAVLCSNSLQEVGKWVAITSKCLCNDMRNFLTAHDASLLSSRLYSLIQTDECVGMLKDMELSIRVNVGDGGGDKVEIDVWSKGVGADEEGSEERGSRGEENTRVMEEEATKVESIEEVKSIEGEDEEKEVAEKAVEKVEKEETVKDTKPVKGSAAPATVPLDSSATVASDIKSVSSVHSVPEMKSDTKSDAKAGVFSTPSAPSAPVPEPTKPVPPQAPPSKPAPPSSAATSVSSASTAPNPVPPPGRGKPQRPRDGPKPPRSPPRKSNSGKSGKGKRTGTPPRQPPRKVEVMAEGKEKKSEGAKAEEAKVEEAKAEEAKPQASTVPPPTSAVPTPASSTAPTVMVHSASSIEGGEGIFTGGIPPPPLTPTVSTEDAGKEGLESAEKLEGELGRLLKETEKMKREVAGGGEKEEEDDGGGEGILSLETGEGEELRCWCVVNVEEGENDRNKSIYCVLRFGAEVGGVRIEGYGGEDTGGGEPEIVWDLTGQEGGVRVGVVDADDDSGSVVVVERKGVGEEGGWKSLMLQPCGPSVVEGEEQEEKAEEWADGVEDREREWREEVEREKRGKMRG